MPYFPYLKPTEQKRLVTRSFTGYDHRPSIADSAFYDGRNLSSRLYPLLASRRRRGRVTELVSPGGLLARDALAYVEDGTLYYNHLPTGLTGLSPGEKQLVGMGAYILVFPDKLYFNTEDQSDLGSMEARLELSGTVSLSPCLSSGEEIHISARSADEPEEPANGQYWLDSSGTQEVLRQYSEPQGLWVELSGVYTMVKFTSMGQLTGLFSALDGVEIEGLPAEGLNGSHIIYALGGGEQQQDYMVLSGLCARAETAEGCRVSIRRTLPEMDFVCQCQNRLWGCRYGLEDGRAVNELYCSALGDFRNFRQYLGLSTDSWAASVGSDGPFTGAISYLGSPCFFKEDRIHTVTVSASGGHMVSEQVCRGVQKGSHKSLCVVGEQLLYKSRSDVCLWQGGFPRSISAPLGDVRYYEAAAGAVGESCYISMRDGAGRWSMFVYDSALDIWQREDELHALCFAECGGELYCIDADSGELLALLGTDGQPEPEPGWSLESGLLRYTTPQRQYISRLSLTMSLAGEGEARLYLRYDSSPDWHLAGSISLAGPATVTLPVRPRRCEHMHFRLEGSGEMSLFALSKIVEPGSDMP